MCSPFIKRASAMDSAPSFPLLTLSLTPQALCGFASLMQHGLLFPVRQPVPILSFLLTLPGFTADYLEKTVQTIFINGVAADSLDQDLAAGMTLALSAAMPGLAGAIFRRQGVHGSLRSQPVLKEIESPSDSGYVTVKLFNAIATDRVADLLTAGILISGQSLHDFAVRREALFAPPTRWRLEAGTSNLPTLLHILRDIPILRIQTRVQVTD